MSKVIIRKGKPEDWENMQHLFVHTISAVCSQDYLPDQIEAWISGPKPQQWIFIFSHQKVWVAEQDNRFLGFITLENLDYIDYLFVHKDFQRKGIGTRLLAASEKEARKLQSKRLIAKVSITALSFFRIRGFEIIKRQTIIRKGVKLTHFKMEKVLS